MSANLRGALAMCLAMAAFAIEDSFFKFATASYAVGPAVFLFGLFGFCLFAGASLYSRKPIFHPAIGSRAMLLRSVSELGGRLFFALALAFTPLTSTAAILQATPLVVVLGAVILLGERVGPRRWVAMGIGFLGVLLILRPTPASFEASSLFAVLATLGFAGRDLATRISPKSMSGPQLGSLGFVVLMVAGLVLMPFDVAPIGVPSGQVLAALMAASAIGVIAYSALTVAMRTGEVGVVTPFRYARMLFALAIAVTMFGERPDAVTLIGAALIVGSGIYSMLRGARQIPAGPGR